MISVQEAEEIISRYKGEWGVEKVELTKSIGRVLSEDILTDRSFPPFDRVTMDGIAIRSHDFSKGNRAFEIVGTQLAGSLPLELNKSNAAIEVMTGAVLPTGTDAVIRYEDFNVVTDETTRSAQVNLSEVKAHLNVHQKGSDQSEGSFILKNGTTIGPPEIGVLATVGKSEVLVQKLPRVAVISTGDEIVPVDQNPLPHQIRMSNAYSLKANLADLHSDIECELFHLKDNFNVLLEKMRQIVSDYDVLILSGGVSKGKADYVPEVLEKLGVTKKFHRVAQRPGKPFWFGVSGEGKAVFALPGNPVSTYTCFIRYVRTWLRKSMGLSNEMTQVVLAEPVQFKPELTYFLQVTLKASLKNGFEVYKSANNGSGDLGSMTASNGIIELPANQAEFDVGGVYNFYPFRTS